MRRSVAFSLGSNLGDRRAALERALARLGEEIEDLSASGLYETAPVEVEEAQPDYLNACAAGRSELSPRQLLALCKRLEAEAGRAPGGHRRPRTLDVDLLLVGDLRLKVKELELPHPGLPRRRFVLEPLAELLPEWRHPESGDSVREMLEALGGEQAVQHHVEEDES